MPLNIVLVEPEIPQNTGNIIRTCAITNTRLHLVRPLGFSMSEKSLKRAGLDYWNLVEIFYYDSFEEVLQKNEGKKFFYLSTKANQSHSDAYFGDEAFLVFGKETKGLPESLIAENMDTAFRVPMLQIEAARSLNLANTVSIVLYEALRQIGYPNMR